MIENNLLESCLDSVYKYQPLESRSLLEISTQIKEWKYSRMQVLAHKKRCELKLETKIHDETIANLEAIYQLKKNRYGKRNNILSVRNSNGNVANDPININ